MTIVRVDTYDRLGRVVHIDIEMKDGYAEIGIQAVGVPDQWKSSRMLPMTMSATELDELAQAASHAADMVRRGEF